MRTKESTANLSNEGNTHAPSHVLILVCKPRSCCTSAHIYEHCMVWTRSAHLINYKCVKWPRAIHAPQRNLWPQGYLRRVLASVH